MKDSKNLRVEVKQADEKVLELIQLISLIKQTGREKYEILKPVADKLNFYCDTEYLKSAGLSIPLKEIYYAEYDKNVLFLLLKKSRWLYVFDFDTRVYTIYMYKEKHNCIFEFFIKWYNSIRGEVIRCLMMKKWLVRQH